MSLIYACALTVLTETAFFLLLGYRRPMFAALCVFVNIATNLALNLTAAAISPHAFMPAAIYALEGAAVAAEYGAYAMALGGSLRLLALTFAANALSYGIGALVFGHF